MPAGCACGVQPALPKSIQQEVLQELCGKTQLKAAEVKALYRRFRLLAPSGYLLPSQFRQTMGAMGLSDDPFIPERMFRVFDADQDGKLSFFEFASSLAIMIRGSEDEKLKLSFEMTAGERGAPHIQLEDFQHLIHACNRMMESLVAPGGHAATVEDINRMFYDISSDLSDDDGAKTPVITIEDYKVAAQTNDDFLSCLGLAYPASTLVSKSNESFGRESSSKVIKRHGSPTAGGPGPEHVLVSTHQLEELREQVMSLRDVVLLEKPGKSSRSPGSLQGLSLAPQDGECEEQDDEERWWTPLKKSDSRSIRIPLDGARDYDEMSAGFDNVLRWCAEHGAGDQATHHLARSCSEDGDFRTFASRPANIHTPKNKSAQSHAKEDEQNSSKSRSQTPRRRKKKVRLLGPKKGLAVHFGHENWNMVLSMMIGIRMAVGRTKHEMSRELTPVDFIIKEKFTIIPRLANIFDSEVSKRVTMTRFIDYAPMVFQKIRSNFGINNDDYMRSVGPEQLLGNMVLGNLSSLAELSSEGKSGAFFYYTSDGKYMLKTVAPKEEKLLKKMLKKYWDHISGNTDTLIVRFLGLHCLKVRKERKGAKSYVQSDRKLHFVVMANMFNTPFEINRRYDLKGSWIGRCTPEHHRDASVAVKDVDFQQADESIRVGKESKDKIVAQIERDTAFLRDQNIIDYSLLLGIHDIVNPNGLTAECDESASDKGGEVTTGKPNFGQLSNFFSGQCQSASTLRSSLSFSDVPVHQRNMGGILSTDMKQLYFFGIIDILTPYDYRKKVEHRLKSVRYDRRGVSCCPPVFYAERFNDFMRNAFA